MPELAIGHRPPTSLSPQDQELFRAFQANLLSLISHELRTPLMGVLNSLTVLEAELPASEWLQTAQRNTQKLQQSLNTLLDLASIESGGFHLRLKEVDLLRLVRARLEAMKVLLGLHQVRVEWVSEDQILSPFFLDPQKVGQAIDLGVQALLATNASPSFSAERCLSVRVSSKGLDLAFPCEPALMENLKKSWSQAWVGIQSGALSPFSAFGGIVQSEQAFLTRSVEGLGSEFFLIHEILRLHQGQFNLLVEDREVRLQYQLPQLSMEDGLKAILRLRAAALSTELGSLALLWVPVPPEGDGVTILQQKWASKLPSSADALYVLQVEAKPVIVLLLNNLSVSQLREWADANLGKVRYGAALMPDQTLDGDDLLRIAQGNCRL